MKTWLSSCNKGDNSNLRNDLRDTKAILAEADPVEGSWLSQ